MSVADWFRGFCANLQIAGRGSISDRYCRITKRLNLDFWDNDSDVANSLYVGSYGRNTAIEGFSDLDMIFRLPHAVYLRIEGYQGNGQSALLQEVRASIKQTYANTNIGADGQVVQVPFSDGITFEIVPAFLNVSNTYTYPNANDGGHWKVTNPRPEIQAIRDRSKETNDNLVRLCRMMRSWKSKWNVPIGGLLIDTLAYQFIDQWQFKDKSYLYYDFLSRDFLLFMANQKETQQYWSAPGSGQRVYRSGNFEYKAKRCYNISLEAIEKETTYPTTAKSKWRDIFGTKFPA